MNPLAHSVDAIAPSVACSPTTSWRGRTARSLPAPPPRGAGPFYVGQALAGGYEVTGLLGSGGMGVVYDGIDRRLRRRVAIKTALAHGYREHVLAEAQALAILRNPAFPEVYGLFDNEGVDFIAMERLTGERLDERILDVKARGARLAIEEILELLGSLARALAVLHAAGVAQRDLKPSNVMLCGGARLVIFDFGLVVPETLVAPNTFLSGSAEYVAPEVLLGSVARGGGPLVDLYALGIVAFELLTSTTPFLAGTLPEVVSRHVHEPAADVRERRADVPEGLALLIRRLLAKPPGDRPASADAVVWELAHLRATLRVGQVVPWRRTAPRA